jgi:type IV pilus assembly protein PilV
MNKIKNKSGFTLIEVLIAMLVLSVGLLGLAGIQARSLKNNVSAHNRAQAIQLAYDIADRIRANVVETKRSAKSNPATSTYATATPKKIIACNSSPGCSSAQLVQNDLFEWEVAINDAFPDIKNNWDIKFREKPPFVIKTGISPIPDSKIKVGIVTISVSWDDDRDGVIANNDPDFKMSFQLWSVEA